MISQVLRERIAAGDYAGLPSEAEIGREFGVARTTVRRALRAPKRRGPSSLWLASDVRWRGRRFSVLRADRE
ncbi:GntR family transcriptional regulator [Streptomyces sp. NPDC056491]|uniref:GntR family transcriptional regulator n=1 Tax=Streptomyces sp. NPDC056491 TaxID=3345837 RepID=UPI0036CF91F9